MDQTQIAALETLARNFFLSQSEVQSILITLRNGEFVSTMHKSQFSSTSEESNFNIPQTPLQVKEKAIVTITQQIEPLLAQITQHSHSKDFSTAVFEADDFRILNVFIDRWVFVFILSYSCSIDRIYPYIYMVTEKIYRILTQDTQVQLGIPKLGNILGPRLIETAESEIKNWVFKFTLVGNSGVGKTSLVNRFVEGKFPHDFRPTIGLNVLTHTYHFMNNRVKLNIFDIGSQQFFKRVRRSYYQGTNVALIVFDLNQRQSFEDIRTWKEELDAFIDGTYALIIVGNKSDLPRTVEYFESRATADLLNALYIETSALLDKNVEEAFVMMTFNLLDQVKKQLDTKASKMD